MVFCAIFELSIDEKAVKTNCEALIRDFNQRYWLQIFGIWFDEESAEVDLTFCGC